MSFVVAIDGPAGSGKGTVTKIVGKELNLVTIDTGAMYRCVTLDCINNNVNVEDIEGIEKVISKIKIEFKKSGENDLVYLNDEDVTSDIRTTEVNSLVAKYAAIKCVRDKMTPLQREMGTKQDIIMEGRDIGTIVFPNADVKIFLDCSVEERARRRYNQNQEKGITSSYEEVLAGIKERHRLETEREIAPFVQAEDAIYLDSTKLTIDEVTQEIIRIVKEKRGF